MTSPVGATSPDSRPLGWPGRIAVIALVVPATDPVVTVPDVAPRPSVALPPSSPRLAVPWAVELPMVQLPGFKSISPSSSVPEAEPDHCTTST
jgi:hypothetical protein